MSLIDKIEEYGINMYCSEDMKCSEAKEIIAGSSSQMEIAGNSYLYGYMRGTRTENVRHVPVLNIKMMSDEEWNRLARKSRMERQAAMA